jgi:hypothetical protein
MQVQPKKERKRAISARAQTAAQHVPDRLLSRNDDRAGERQGDEEGLALATGLFRRYSVLPLCCGARSDNEDL